MPAPGRRPSAYPRTPNAYPMIFQLFATRPLSFNIDALYGAIVAQARLPGFYLGYGVPDTVEGRFDMIVLHLVLLFRRLASEPKATRDLSQGVFERFCQDMDHNLREMGVSDPSVPKEMRRIGEAFYGRAEAYERAIAAAGDDRGQLLASALARNVFAEPSVSSKATHLAAYVMAAAHWLEGAETAEVIGGGLKFPDPDTVAAGDHVQP
jgi:cytochrome b pre-mRNA-processing protein 3